MRAAGIRQYSAPVEYLELPDPGELRPDEVLLDVRCCGVGNWVQQRTNGQSVVLQPGLTPASDHRPL